MATLAEIASLIDDAGLLDKMRAAIIMAASDIIDAGNITAQQRRWIKVVTYDANGEGRKALRIVLGKFGPTQTVEQIQAIDDATIITQVNSVVPILVAALSNE